MFGLRDSLRLFCSLADALLVEITTFVASLCCAFPPFSVSCASSFTFEGKVVLIVQLESCVCHSFLDRRFNAVAP